HAIIAQIQGSLLLLKVTQDLNVLESNFDLLKTSFEKVGEK
ncbi:MAG: TetR/AcrR family transcriptional regulator, partial [Streptococcus vestibularis]|nr:TetR/AcrR family transcriptional regulator [Streptococcus vestibularis]